MRGKDDYPITDKMQIIMEIQEYYQNLFNSQKINDNDIEAYLRYFTPPNLTDCR